MRKNNFWNLYVELAEKRMQPKDRFYKSLNLRYSRIRRSQARFVSDRITDPFPTSSVRFFNQVFLDVETRTGRSIKNKKMAHAAYGFRLPEHSNARDLLAIDAFKDFTTQQDLPIVRFLQGINRDAQDRRTLTDGLTHCFLHMPQRSGYLFFHEIIVGGLLDEMMNGEVRKTRRSMSVRKVVPYYTLANEAINVLAGQLKMPRSSLFRLHLATHQHVKKIFPQRVADLMTSAAHIYFRIESELSRKGHHLYPADLLALVVEFYLLPVLEIFGLSPEARMITQPDSKLLTIFEIKPAQSTHHLDQNHLRQLLARQLTKSWRTIWKT